MDFNNSGDSDKSFDPRVVTLANALEQEAVRLLQKEPLNTTDVSVALSKFPTKPAQVQAMIDAVQKVNVAHHQDNPSVPSLKIIRQEEGNWDAVNIYFDVQTIPNRHYSETLYTYPLVDKASSGDQTGKQTQPESGSSEPVEQGKLVPGMNLGAGGS